jgi:hypothetical protein
MRCNACQGHFEPATGYKHSERTALCGSCAIEFFDWLGRQVKYQSGAAANAALRPTLTQCPAVQPLSAAA